MLCIFWHLTKKALCGDHPGFVVLAVRRWVFLEVRIELVDTPRRSGVTSRGSSATEVWAFRQRRCFFFVWLPATAWTSLGDDSCPSKRGQLLALTLAGLVAGVTGVADARAAALVAARVAARTATRAAARTAAAVLVRAIWRRQSGSFGVDAPCETQHNDQEHDHERPFAISARKRTEEGAPGEPFPVRNDRRVSSEFET